MVFPFHRVYVCVCQDSDVDVEAISDEDVLQEMVRWFAFGLIFCEPCSGYSEH